MCASVVLCGLACSSRSGGTQTEIPRPPSQAAAVRPGITVLLDDSLALIRGKRIGLLTNQTGVDERGVSDIELLRGARARAAGVTLVRLFSPEHGIRGTEDHEQVASGIDAQSGLPVHSLYTVTAIAPPDSLLRDLDVLVFDLQDIGTRTWTYVGSMIYAMHAAARRNLTIVVLDRPNPITGNHVDGPMLDMALSNPAEHTSQKAAKPYALYPFPLRHGMTMGELALFYNSVLGIGAPLHVVPAAGWTRSMWFDQTGLPWVRPSPNLPTLTSALVYPSLVAFEGSNVSVGRGTPDAFQRFGASWMDAVTVAAALNGRQLPGVRFVVDSFTPKDPGDQKFGGKHIPGIRVDVTDRDRVQSGRVSAAILWALVQTNRDSLRITARTFDERFGSTAIREAIVGGADPDVALAQHQSEVDAFRRRAARFLMYR
ncbi:MAG: DUF1343 domain-containing protein [Gemmatimonadaceae bacterium]